MGAGLHLLKAGHVSEPAKKVSRQKKFQSLQKKNEKMKKNNEKREQKISVKKVSERERKKKKQLWLEQHLCETVMETPDALHFQQIYCI